MTGRIENLFTCFFSRSLLQCASCSHLEQVSSGIWCFDKQSRIEVLLLISRIICSRTVPSVLRLTTKACFQWCYIKSWRWRQPLFPTAVAGNIKIGLFGTWVLGRYWNFTVWILSSRLTSTKSCQRTHGIHMRAFLLLSCDQSVQSGCTSYKWCSSIKD